MSNLPGYPIPRSKWMASADGCTACTKAFNFFSAKDNCPNCGRIFCSSCLSAECSLSPEGYPVAVCLECFQKIMEWRRNHTGNGTRGAQAVANAGSPALPRLAAAVVTSSSPLEGKVATLENQINQLTTSAEQLRGENASLVKLLCSKEAGEKERQSREDAAALRVQQEQKQMESLAQSHDKTAASLRSTHQQLVSSEAACKFREEEVASLKQSNSSLTTQLADAQYTIRALEEASLSKEKNEEEKRNFENSNAAAGIAALKAQQKELQAALRTSTEVCARLQGERDTALIRVGECEPLITRLHADLVELRGQVDHQANVEADATVKQEEVNTLIVELSKARGSIHELESREALAQKTAEEVEKECAVARSAMGAMEQQLLYFRTREDSWVKKENTSTQRIEELEEELAQLRAQEPSRRTTIAAHDVATCTAEAEVPAGGASASRWCRGSRIEELHSTTVAATAPSSIPTVRGVSEWSFDTKAVAAETSVEVLVRVGHQIAVDWALFPDASAMQRWVSALDALSANYRHNPYHNAVHAADVLQGVYALAVQSPELVAQLTLVEKRAIVFAAAAHDVRHPGRTEMFLKNTFDATFIEYNGWCVLEQMHSASAFQLLRDPALDFTAADMSDAAALRFLELVQALILSTYMGNHIMQMEAWAKPLRGGGTFDFAKVEDRQAALCMLLHAADIGAQSRDVNVALKWLDVVEEMCQEGDEEAVRGLPVCPGGSRTASVEPGQLFFMETFVIPLFDLVHQHFPAIDAPLANLRELHARYSAATAGSPRTFPSPVRHSPELVAAAPVQLDATALRQRERKLQATFQRLQQAATVVAEREAAVSEKEASLSASLAAAQSTAEEELRQVASAVVQREESVLRKAADVEKMTVALEEREAAIARLSTQLATIAEEVNRRRRLLRYRESRVRSSDAPGLESTAERPHGSTTFSGRSAGSVSGPDRNQFFSCPSGSLDLGRLERARGSLGSAMSYM